MVKKIFGVLFALFSIGCLSATKKGVRHLEMDRLKVPSQTVVGTASWYGGTFHGRMTANGEIYNMYELTAAHKSLPFGSLLRVTNLSNEKKLFVRVNDRGPYIPGRILDLSYGAARELGMVDAGVRRVKIEVLSPKGFPPSNRSGGSALRTS